MPTASIIFCGVAVVLIACFALVWFMDTHRSRRVAVDETRLEKDEQKYAEVTPDPHNRMR